jgi:hypothetical protein
MKSITVKTKEFKIIKLVDIILAILAKYSLIDMCSFRNWVGAIFQLFGSARILSMELMWL